MHLVSIKLRFIGCLHLSLVDWHLLIVRTIGVRSRPMGLGLVWLKGSSIVCHTIKGKLLVSWTLDAGFFRKIYELKVRTPLGLKPLKIIAITGLSQEWEVLDSGQLLGRLLPNLLRKSEVLKVLTVGSHAEKGDLYLLNTSRGLVPFWFCVSFYYHLKRLEVRAVGRVQVHRQIVFGLVSDWPKYVAGIGFFLSKFTLIHRGHLSAMI